MNGIILTAALTLWGLSGLGVGYWLHYLKLEAIRREFDEEDGE